jgi:hypothetical protein
MKFSKETISDLIEYGENHTIDGITLIEEGDWYVVHKGEAKDYIVLYEDKFYRFTEGREGSPFTEWYYTSEYAWSSGVPANEVEMVEVKTYQWVRVRK